MKHILVTGGTVLFISSCLIKVMNKLNSSTIGGRETYKLTARHLSDIRSISN